MRIELVAGALALLASSAIQNQPPLMDSLPYERGVYRVQATVITSGVNGGVLQIGDQWVNVRGNLPAAGTLAEMRLRYTPDGHRLESSGAPITRTRFDLDENSDAVVGELRPNGIRVGDTLIEVAHNGPVGQWVKARISNNTLNILENLNWSNGRLAGYPVRSRRPTHTEDGVWVG